MALPVAPLQNTRMPVDPAKLEAFKKQHAVAVAGGQRRKVAAVHKPAVQEDKKLKTALNRLNLKDIPAIDEVNMIKDDGTMLQFKHPKVQATSGAYVVAGHAESKKQTDMFNAQTLADLQKALASGKFNLPTGGADLPDVSSFDAAAPALE